MYPRVAVWSDCCQCYWKNQLWKDRKMNVTSMQLCDTVVWYPTVGCQNHLRILPKPNNRAKLGAPSNSVRGMDVMKLKATVLRNERIKCAFSNWQEQQSGLVRQEIFWQRAKPVWNQCPGSMKMKSIHIHTNMTWSLSLFSNAALGILVVWVKAKLLQSINISWMKNRIQQWDQVAVGAQESHRETIDLSVIDGAENLEREAYTDDWRTLSRDCYSTWTHSRWVWGSAHSWWI
jgi:hypothetical protein